MTYQFEPSGKVKELSATELAAADNDCAIIVRYAGTLRDGSPYWAYIAVKPSKYDEFMQEKQRPIVLEDYGSILRYGFESEVPLHIKEEMKQHYGCDDNYKENLTKEVKAAQIMFLQQQETSRIGDIVAMLKRQSGGTA